MDERRERTELTSKHAERRILLIRIRSSRDGSEAIGPDESGIIGGGIDGFKFELFLWVLLDLILAGDEGESPI